MRYSLADYILTVTNISSEFGLSTIQIGGEGSYVGSINVSRSQNTYETTGDSTGSWVHTKNLNMTGTIEIQLNQLAEKITQLRTLFNIYYKNNIKEGLTLTITDNEGNIVHTGIDCFIQKLADPSYGETAQTQSWVFTCGQILDE